MSERVVTIYPEMPPGYDMLSAIEIKENEEAVRYNGIIELGEGEAKIQRRVLLPDLKEIFPIEEVQNQDPEKQELKDQIEELRGLVNGFQARLEEQHRVHQESIQNLQDDHEEKMRELTETHNTQIEELRTQLEEAKKGEPPTEFNNSDEVKILVDGKVLKGNITSDEPVWDQDKNAWVYEVETGDQSLIATIHELRVWQTLDLTPPPGEPEEEDVSDNKWRSNWARIRGRLGDFATFRNSSRRALATLQSRGAQRVVKVTEEEYYDAEAVDRGGRRLGAVALIGIGALGWWLIDQIEDHGERKYGIPKANIAKTVTDSGAVTGHGGGAPSTLLGIPGPNTSGRHVDYFNSAVDHRFTGLSEPKKLHLIENINGNHRLVDGSGNTIVPHNKLSWDRQGNLSRASRAYLKAKNYSLTQGKLGQRFMTEIWKR